MKPELNIALSRLVASLIVPGFVAAGPWFFVVGQHFPSMRDWLLSGSLAPSTVVVLIVFTSGLLMEELGSWIEWKLWDRGEGKWRQGEAAKTYRNDWYAYLLEENVPPTMEDYISHVVSRLKWELSGVPAFLTGALAMICESLTRLRLGCADFFVPWQPLAVAVILVALAFFLFRQGWDSMDYLVKLRSELLLNAKKQAPQQDY